MNRREVIQSLGLVSTHALFPSILSGFLTGCTSSNKEDKTYLPLFFSEKEFSFIKETIDIILPVTKTASASQVRTHYFLDEVFAKCLNQEQQALIKEGLSGFIDNFNIADDKVALIRQVDKNAFKNIDDYVWFKSIKQYTLIGFFTSQEGTTKASKYVAVPGDYKGNIPMDGSTLNYGRTGQHYYI